MQPRRGPWGPAQAEGTRAGPTREQDLQLAHDLEGGQADAAAFGFSRSKVTNGEAYLAVAGLVFDRAARR